MRKLPVVLLGAVLLALTLAPGSPTPKAAGPSVGKLDEAWWRRTEPYLRRVMNLSRAVELELKQIEPAGAPEFLLVIVEARSGERASPLFFYASADGTKIVVDQVYDLARDPFAENRKRIRLDSVPTLGPESALVTLVEYSDYTCPFCQRFFLTVRAPLLKGYEGRMRYVFKNFPLVGLRAWSETAAVAAACAFRQSNEAFWALHEQLFIHTGRLQEKTIFSELAQKLPLDAQQFETCIKRRETLEEVRRDIVEAESLGVEGTPTFFINGRPVHGLPSRERFLEIVDEELTLAQHAVTN